MSFRFFPTATRQKKRRKINPYKLAINNLLRSVFFYSFFSHITIFCIFAVYIKDTIQIYSAKPIQSWVPNK